MNEHHETWDDGSAVMQLMDRSMSDVHAPVERLGRTALVRGRAQRLRRRTASAALGVAAVVAVGVALPHLAGDGARTDGTGPAGNPTVIDTPSPTPSTEPAGWWDMAATKMLDRLVSALPDGTRVVSAETRNTDRAPGEEPATMQGYLLAHLRTDGVNGPGGLNMVFYPPGTDSAGELAPGDVPTPSGSATATFESEPSNESRLSCPGDLESYDYCRVLQRPDGSVYGRESRWEVDGVEVLDVNFAAPDGGVVYVSVANSVDEKWGPGSEASAPEPPLTLEQLWAIAEDPTWQDWTPASD